jgi:hypothetical protein
VEECTLDGTSLPPLTSDPIRWQRVVFDARDYVYVQRMSGSLIIASIKPGTGRTTLALEHAGQPHPELKELFGTSWTAEFSVTIPLPMFWFWQGSIRTVPRL